MVKINFKVISIVLIQLFFIINLALGDLFALAPEHIKYEKLKNIEDVYGFVFKEEEFANKVEETKKNSIEEAERALSEIKGREAQKQPVRFSLLRSAASEVALAGPYDMQYYKKAIELYIKAILRAIEYKRVKELGIVLKEVYSLFDKVDSDTEKTYMHEISLRFIPAIAKFKLSAGKIFFEITEILSQIYMKDYYENLKQGEPEKSLEAEFLLKLWKGIVPFLSEAKAKAAEQIKLLEFIELNEVLVKESEKLLKEIKELSSKKKELENKRKSFTFFRRGRKYKKIVEELKINENLLRDKGSRLGVVNKGIENNKKIHLSFYSIMNDSPFLVGSAIGFVERIEGSENLNSYLAQVLYRIGDSYLNANDSKAFDYYFRAIDVYSNLNRQDMADEIFEKLDKLYETPGISLESNFRKAEYEYFKGNNLNSAMFYLKALFRFLKDNKEKLAQDVEKIKQELNGRKEEIRKQGFTEFSTENIEGTIVNINQKIKELRQAEKIVKGNEKVKLQKRIDFFAKLKSRLSLIVKINGARTEYERVLGMDIKQNTFGDIFKGLIDAVSLVLRYNPKNSMYIETRNVDIDLSKLPNLINENRGLLNADANKLLDGLNDYFMEVFVSKKEKLNQLETMCWQVELIKDRGFFPEDIQEDIKNSIQEISDFITVNDITNKAVLKTVKKTAEKLRSEELKISRKRSRSLEVQSKELERKSKKLETDYSREIERIEIEIEKLKKQREKIKDLKVRKELDDERKELEDAVKVFKEEIRKLKDKSIELKNESEKLKDERNIGVEFRALESQVFIQRIKYLFSNGVSVKKMGLIIEIDKLIKNKDIVLLDNLLIELNNFSNSLKKGDDFREDISLSYFIIKILNFKLHEEKNEIKKKDVLYEGNSIINNVYKAMFINKIGDKEFWELLAREAELFSAYDIAGFAWGKIGVFEKVKELQKSNIIRNGGPEDGRIVDVSPNIKSFISKQGDLVFVGDIAKNGSFRKGKLYFQDGKKGEIIDIDYDSKKFNEDLATFLKVKVLSTYQGKDPDLLLKRFGNKKYTLRRMFKFKKKEKYYDYLAKKAIKDVERYVKKGNFEIDFFGESSEGWNSLKLQGFSEEYFDRSEKELFEEVFTIKKRVDEANYELRRNLKKGETVNDDQYGDLTNLEVLKRIKERLIKKMNDVYVKIYKAHEEQKSDVIKDDLENLKRHYDNKKMFLEVILDKLDKFDYFIEEGGLIKEGSLRSKGKDEFGYIVKIPVVPRNQSVFNSIFREVYLGVIFGAGNDNVIGAIDSLFFGKFIKTVSSKGISSFIVLEKAGKRIVGLDLLQIKKVLLQIGNGVIGIHDKGGIHGDLKFENILESRVKGVDYVITDVGGSSDNNTSEYLVFTENTLAPEHLKFIEEGLYFSNIKFLLGESFLEKGTQDVVNQKFDSVGMGNIALALATGKQRAAIVDVWWDGWSKNKEQLEDREKNIIEKINKQGDPRFRFFIKTELFRRLYYDKNREDFIAVVGPYVLQSDLYENNWKLDKDDNFLLNAIISANHPDPKKRISIKEFQNEIFKLKVKVAKEEAVSTEEKEEVIVITEKPVETFDEMMERFDSEISEIKDLTVEPVDAEFRDADETVDTVDEIMAGIKSVIPDWVAEQISVEPVLIKTALFSSEVLTPKEIEDNLKNPKEENKLRNNLSPNEHSEVYDLLYLKFKNIYLGDEYKVKKQMNDIFVFGSMTGARSLDGRVGIGSSHLGFLREAKGVLVDAGNKYKEEGNEVNLENLTQAKLVYLGAVNWFVNLCDHESKHNKTEEEVLREMEDSNLDYETAKRNVLKQKLTESGLENLNFNTAKISELEEIYVFYSGLQSQLQIDNQMDSRYMEKYKNIFGGIGITSGNIQDAISRFLRTAVVSLGYTEEAFEAVKTGLGFEEEKIEDLQVKDLVVGKQGKNAMRLAMKPYLMPKLRETDEQKKRQDPLSGSDVVNTMVISAGIEEMNSFLKEIPGLIEDLNETEDLGDKKRQAEIVKRILESQANIVYKMITKMNETGVLDITQEYILALNNVFQDVERPKSERIALWVVMKAIEMFNKDVRGTESELEFKIGFGQGFNLDINGLKLDPAQTLKDLRKVGFEEPSRFFDAGLGEERLQELRAGVTEVVNMESIQAILAYFNKNTKSKITVGFEGMLSGRVYEKIELDEISDMAGRLLVVSA